jgi:hypothetical protein
MHMQLRMHLLQLLCVHLWPVLSAVTPAISSYKRLECACKNNAAATSGSAVRSCRIQWVPKCNWHFMTNTSNTQFLQTVAAICSIAVGNSCHLYTLSATMQQLCAVQVPRQSVHANMLLNQATAAVQLLD